MKKILFAEKFEVDPLVIGATVFTHTKVTHNRNEYVDCEVQKMAVSCQTSEDSLASNDKCVQRESTEEKLQCELESIFKTCKKQLEYKAELAAKIKHADWLRGGQTLEEAIFDYFKGALKYKH